MLVCQCPAPCRAAASAIGLPASFTAIPYTAEKTPAIKQSVSPLPRLNGCWPPNTQVEPGLSKISAMTPLRIGPVRVPRTQEIPIAMALAARKRHKYLQSSRFWQILTAIVLDFHNPFQENGLDQLFNARRPSSWTKCREPRRSARGSPNASLRSRAPISWSCGDWIGWPSRQPAKVQSADGASG